MKVVSDIAINGKLTPTKATTYNDYTEVAVIGPESELRKAAKPSPGGGEQTEYYVVNSIGVSPSTNIINAAPISTIAYIYLEHHGLENVVGAYKISIDLLFYGSKIYLTTDPGFKIDVALSYGVDLTLLNDSVAGNFPRISNIKVVSRGGEYVRYTNQAGSSLHSHGALREQDITFDAVISNAQLLLKITNNIMYNPNPDIPESFLSVYGMYQISNRFLYKSTDIAVDEL